MATPPNLWGGGSGERLPFLLAPDQTLGRRRARRMSRRFGRVGVEIAPARLQAIAAGAVPAADEATDVRFALVATEIQRAERSAKRERGKRRGLQWLVVAALMLAALNLLGCTVYVFVSVLLGESAL